VKECFHPCCCTVLTDSMPGKMRCHHVLTHSAAVDSRQSRTASPEPSWFPCRMQTYARWAQGQRPCTAMAIKVWASGVAYVGQLLSTSLEQVCVSVSRG
jgi:hypothetical protein